MGRLTFAVFLVLFGLAATPILTAPIPPLFDYPNHLGRMAILAAAGHDPILNRYYAVRWALLPNLAMDVVVPPLARFMPLESAGCMFLLITLLMLAAGPVVLHRVWWGRWSPWACVGFLFLYNRTLLWGFVNYLAGVGLAFLAMALWISLDRRSWILRGVVGAIATVAIYFCHLEAFAVVALMLVGVELRPMIAALERGDASVVGTRAAALAAALSPATLLFLFTWRPHASGAGMAVPRLGRKLDLLFSVFDNYSRPFDVSCFVLVVLALIVGLASRRIIFLSAAAWPLLLVAVFYLALPSTLFTGAGADHRLPVVLFMLLVAATRPAPLPIRSLWSLGCAVAVLFVVRMGIVEAVWGEATHTYAEDSEILSRLPVGARVAVAAPARSVQVERAPLYHFPVLAIVLRQAFVPTLFAYDTQQPVRLRPPWFDLAAQTDPDGVWLAFQGHSLAADADRGFVLDHYDAVAFVDAQSLEIRTLPCLTLLGEYSKFSLYKIAKEPGRC